MFNDIGVGFQRYTISLEDAIFEFGSTWSLTVLYHIYVARLNSWGSSVVEGRTVWEPVDSLRNDKLHHLIACLDVLNLPPFDDSPYNPRLCVAIFAPLHWSLLSHCSLCWVDAVCNELPLVPCLMRLCVWRTDKGLPYHDSEAGVFLTYEGNM